MPELGKNYEDLIEKDAKAIKEDTLKELAAYEEMQARRVAGGEEEPRALSGPYSYNVRELMGHVEQETKLGRDAINAMSHLKAMLQKGGE